MNEFAYYSYTNLGFIAVGSSICMLGIMYKVCTLENADQTDEKDVYIQESEGEEVEMIMASSTKESDEKFVNVLDYDV